MNRLLASLLALPLVAAALSGCVQTPSATPEVDANALLDLLPAAEPLWNNPQTAPHPLFNYPTLTHPATGANVPEWWLPIDARPLPETIAGMEVVAEAGAQVKRGAGMSVFGRLAVVPGYGEPTTVLDITDPANPVVLGELKGDDEPAHRNVDFIAYPDGRLVIVLATGVGEISVWEITDPRNPVKLAKFEPTAGTHKVNVVPGTPIVYNANSNGGAGSLGPALLAGMTPETAEGITEIYDLSDPANPVLVQDWKNGFGCHHIYFWNSAEKQRALCAGIEFTQIWDTADPRNPTVVSSIPVHHGVAGTPSASVPIMAFSHFSILNDDGTVLIVGDEMGGGSIPPGCTVKGAPTGAIWFYDVSDETDPQLLGWFSPGHHMDPDRARASCTAHHGRLVPHAERDLLAMAFYGAGVALVDFTDPKMPRLVDQWNDGTNTWEVQYYNGYLFTGDLNRGMDVLTFK